MALCLNLELTRDQPRTGACRQSKKCVDTTVYNMSGVMSLHERSEIPPDRVRKQIALSQSEYPRPPRREWQMHVKLALVIVTNVVHTTFNIRDGIESC